jgi:hypothetical protein
VNLLRRLWAYRPVVTTAARHADRLEQEYTDGYVRALRERLDDDIAAGPPGYRQPTGRPQLTVLTGGAR